MTHATILIGPLTRDFIRWPVMGLGRPAGSRAQWSQPGGAVWHAGLALALTSDQADARVFAIATAGPWAQRNGIPGLVAAGVGWRGVESATETTFVNRYDPDRRRQTLLSMGEPLTREALVGALAGLAPAVAVVSPLMPGDTPAGAGVMLSAAGAFVAADVQGFLRVRGSRGQIERRRVDLREALAGVRAVKFSEREFRVYAGLGLGGELRPAAVEAARELRAEVIVSLGAGGALVAVPGGAVPGEDRVVDVASPSLRREADTTGAGDILIAMYARGRSQGLAAAAALDRAVGEAGGVLRSRGEGERAAGSDLGAALEALQLVAALVRRRERRGDACPDSFLPEGALARALAAHLPSPLPGATSAAGRAMAAVGACFALRARGWPDDARLRAEALAALVGEGGGGCRRRADRAARLGIDGAEAASLPQC